MGSLPKLKLPGIGEANTPNLLNPMSNLTQDVTNIGGNPLGNPLGDVGKFIGLEKDTAGFITSKKDEPAPYTESAEDRATRRLAEGVAAQQAADAGVLKAGANQERFVVRGGRQGEIKRTGVNVGGQPTGTGLVVS